MILLSISPFIFIQCGSGGGVVWGGVDTGMRGGARRRADVRAPPRFHTGRAPRGSAGRPFRSI